MSTMKIKKGDTVKVIAGKDKGKEGKVTAVNAKNNTVLVEGVNVVKKHTKPNAANQQGGIVRLVFKGKATKVGFKYEESDKGLVKVRVAKATGEVIN